MKRVLITGGSGFIGTNLIESLLKDNFTVLNVDKAAPVRNEHKPYWAEADILDQPALDQIAMKFSPHVIIHLAAVTDLDGKDLEYYHTNIQGTQNIINAAERLPGLKKIVFTSSMYVCKPGYIPADYRTFKPHTPYGQSKAEGESRVFNIKAPHYDWVIIRPTSIWGPWFSVPYIDFFNVVYQKKYFDFGRACTKTYGYVGNTVYQIRKIMDSDKVHGKTFYLGDNQPIPISAWANEISQELGNGPIKTLPFIVIKTAALVGDVFSKLGIRFPMTSFRLSNMMTDNIFPLTDLTAITGNPPYSRAEGVSKTINWLLTYKGYKLKQSFKHQPVGA